MTWKKNHVTPMHTYRNQRFPPMTHGDRRNCKHACKHVPPAHHAWPKNYIRGKGPRISADIRGICPGYNSHGYLPISRAYATDICQYPVGGTQTLTLTEKN